LNKRTRGRYLLVAAALMAAVALGCSDENGEQPTVIDGNVASAPTAAVETQGTWLARVAESVRSLMAPWRTVHAEGASDVDDIEVTVRGEKGEASTRTDSSGEFRFDRASPGDLTVALRRRDCRAEFPLSAVVDGSNVTLEDVTFDCGSAAPDEIAEQFEGIVRTKQDTPEGSLEVCVDLGDEFGTRTVEAGDAEIHDPDGDDVGFADVHEGDQIFAVGNREGTESSSLDADTVQILSRDNADPCLAAGATPSPEGSPAATETPSGSEPTATPESGGETPTPTPEAGGEPTATASPETTGEPEATATEAPPSEATPSPTGGFPIPFLDELFGPTPTPGEGETPTPSGGESTPSPS
jgi:hypothetical protein